jgi:hypothetical protein
MWQNRTPNDQKAPGHAADHSQRQSRMRQNRTPNDQKAANMAADAARTANETAKATTGDSPDFGDSEIWWPKT